MLFKYKYQFTLFFKYKKCIFTSNDKFMRVLYNKDKWLGIWDLPKYNKLREKIISSFSDLQFVEEGHKYFINGKELTSVSVTTHLFKEEINVDELAQGTYERNFDNEMSKYYRMTVDEIKEMWKKISSDACSHGTERHEFGESCFYYMIGQYDKILPSYKDRLQEDGGFLANDPKEEAVVKFYEKIPKELIPILAETKVYDEELGYAGTFDILFYYDCPTDETKSGFFICDWKTNKDLFKNFNNQKLLEPFSGLLDSPISLYKLQLSLYENCLDKIGLKTVARRIIWLKPEGTYEKINLESYMNILRSALKNINKNK